MIFNLIHLLVRLSPPGFQGETCKMVSVLMSSQGGVGSTHFMAKLTENNLTSNSHVNADGIKHISSHFYASSLDGTYIMTRTQPFVPKIHPLSKTSRCIAARKLVVIIGNVPHSLNSVTRRFGVVHINTLRRNMYKPSLPENMAVDAIRALPPEELGFEFYRSSWTQLPFNPNVKVLTTTELYAHLNTIMKWIKDL